jgi:hypothetical protein
MSRYAVCGVQFSSAVKAVPTQTRHLLVCYEAARREYATLHMGRKLIKLATCQVAGRRSQPGASTVHILLAGHPERASQISRDVLHLYCALVLNWHCLTTSYVQHISPPLLVVCVARTREMRDSAFFFQRTEWNCLKYTDNITG